MPADRNPPQLRGFREIRADAEGTATVRNLVEVLAAKLSLVGRYGAHEYEAGRAGLGTCAAVFRELAHTERRQIERLLELLSHQGHAGDTGRCETAPLKEERSE